MFGYAVMLNAGIIYSGGLVKSNRILLFEYDWNRKNINFFFALMAFKHHHFEAIIIYA